MLNGVRAYIFVYEDKSMVGNVLSVKLGLDRQSEARLVLQR